MLGGPWASTIPTWRPLSTISRCFTAFRAGSRRRSRSSGARWKSARGRLAPATPSWPLNDADDAHTHVVFPMAGTYVLRLTANDGVFSSYDEVIITVTDPTPETTAPTVPQNLAGIP